MLLAEMKYIVNAESPAFAGATAKIANGETKLIAADKKSSTVSD